jgi:hypothetical protein
VIDLSAATLRAEVYIPKQTVLRQQDTTYLDLVIRAASRRALPEPYICELAALKADIDQNRY